MRNRELMERHNDFEVFTFGGFEPLLLDAVADLCLGLALR